MALNNQILIVDDDPITRELIKFFLEEKGYSVLEAINGEEALVKLKSNNPFLIITDLYMPEKTGIELIKTIRLDLKLSVPIIAMSSDDTDDLVMFAFDLGANDIIKKPIEAHILYERINKLLENKWINT